MTSKDTRNIAKSVTVVSLITLLSRILGLAREIVRAALLGTSHFNDAFTLAFALPNLFRRLTAEGIMANAFIPIFVETRQKNGKEKAMAFAANFFWLMTITLTIFCALFILFAPWLVSTIFAPGFDAGTLDLTIFLTRFLFVYILFISLASIFQGVLNSASVFWISSFTPILLNICIIGAAIFFAPRLSNPTYGFAIGVLIGGFLQAAIQIPASWRRGFRFLVQISFFDKRIKQAGILMLPAIFGVGIYQINIIISNLIASTLAEGSVSSLSFSNRIMEFVLGVLIVSITTVYLPRLSMLFIENKTTEIRTTLANLIPLIAYVTLPATIGLVVIRKDVVAMLFSRGEFDLRSIEMTSRALQFHIIGLTAIAWNRILLSCYQAAKRIQETMWISFVVMIINLLLAFWISGFLGHAGIALANTVSQIAQTVLLIVFIRKLSITGIGPVFINRHILKTIINCAVLAVTLVFSRSFLINAGCSGWLLTMSLIVIGTAIYLVFSLLLKNKELVKLLELVIKRKKATP